MKGIFEKLSRMILGHKEGLGPSPSRFQGSIQRGKVVTLHTQSCFQQRSEAEPCTHLAGPPGILCRYSYDLPPRMKPSPQSTT